MESPEAYLKLAETAERSAAKMNVNSHRERLLKVAQCFRELRRQALAERARRERSANVP